MSTVQHRIVPQHVAIIMDGNGRWANARGLPRTFGHRKGVETVRDTVKAAGEAGIAFLTLFTFSSENWRRPEAEVNELFGLLKAFIRRDLAELHNAGVRIKVIGDRDSLRDDIRTLLLEAEETTAGNAGMTLVIAFNYGSRDEIARAAARLAAEVKAGRLEPSQIDAQKLNDYLDTAGIPDPDLVIRTSGEERLSNFLLWQAAYAELMFVPDFWPDFTPALFDSVLERYAARDRRFGGLSAKAVAVGS